MTASELMTGTDVGECQQEIQSCQGGQFVVTQPSIGPSAESCDGLENDCDEATDEDPQALCDDGIGCTQETCSSGACTTPTPDDVQCGVDEIWNAQIGCESTICPCIGVSLGGVTWIDAFSVDERTPGIFGAGTIWLRALKPLRSIVLPAYHSQIRFEILSVSSASWAVRGANHAAISWLCREPALM